MATILIVEDDPVMSRLYHRVFSIEGHTVVIANDGEEGILKAKEVKPTLMLLDIMMPKMNGFQVLEQLKRDPVTAGIPIIMLTNLAGTQEMENAMTRGAIKYLIKSELEPAHLTSIIREVLSGLPSTTSSTGPTPPPAAPTPPAPSQESTPSPTPQPPAQSSTEEPGIKS